MTIRDAGRAIYRSLWITGGSRFLARSRLRVMNILSVTAVAVLSIYVIIDWTMIYSERKIHLSSRQMDTTMLSNDIGRFGFIGFVPSYFMSELS
jgi:hypothetical protein